MTNRDMIPSKARLMIGVVPSMNMSKSREIPPAALLMGPNSRKIKLKEIQYPLTRKPGGDNYWFT